MTVFNAGPAGVTANFNPGDIGYVKKGLGHYIENTGSTDLVFLAVFRRSVRGGGAGRLAGAHAAELVAANFNLDPAVIAKFPANRPDMMPE